MKKVNYYKAAILNEITTSIGEIKNEDYILLANTIKSKDRIFLSATGRCRLIIEAFCMRLNHLGINSFVVGNIPCPSSSDKDLLISLSGSGTTNTTLNIENKAINLNIETVLITTNKEITNVPNRKIICINAPNRNSDINNDLSKQLMGSLFEQSSFIFLEIVVAILSDKIDRNFIINNHENLE